MKSGLLCAFVFVAACGPGPVLTPEDLGAAGDLAAAGSPDLTGPAGYPAGPYGNTVGAIFPPLLWEGYVNDAADAVSTTKPYVDSYGMNAVRLTGKRYALIHNSDYY